MSRYVFLHGFCGSNAYFDGVRPYFENEEALWLELAGHGVRPVGPNTLDGFADDVIEQLDAAGVADAFFVGHSFGGYVALNLLRRYPSRVGGVVLLHSTAQADTSEGRLNRTKAIERIQTEGVEAFVNQMIPNLFMESSNADHVDRARQIALAMSETAIVNAQTAIRDRVDETETVRLTSRPMLFIYGEFDRLMDEHRAFSGATEQHRTVRVPTSHMGMFDSPELIASTIQTWMEELKYG